MAIKLLRRPNPYENESLASYIMRLAIENSCKIYWLISEFHLQNLMNSNWPRTRTMELISNAVDLPIDEIVNLTLRRYSDETIHYNEEHDGYFNSYLRSFLSSNYMSSCKSKFCPLCLQTKKYHRIYWQLEPIYICIDHNTYLINKCENCGKELSVEDVVLNHCTCGFNLLDASITICDNYAKCSIQKMIYSIYKITEPLDEDQHINFLNITVTEYFRFAIFVKTIMFKLNIYDHKYNSDLAYYNEVFQGSCYLEYCDNIILDRPNNLSNFFRKIDDHTYRYKDKLKRAYGPLALFADEFNSLKHIDIFYKAYCQYFLDNFNYEHFKKILASYLVKNEYIKANQVSELFFLSYKAIVGYFKIAYINGEAFIKLEDIIDLFLVFIREGKFIADNQSHDTINNIFEGIRKVNINLQDIIQATIYGNEEIMINPFCIGGKMLRLKHNNMLKILKKFYNTQYPVKRERNNIQA